MIIDETYFTGPLNIEGLHDESVTSAAIVTGLRAFIERYGGEYLRLILGEKLSCEFIKYLKDDSDDKKLIERWERLHELLAERDTPLANYVFFQYARKRQVQMTSLGATASTISDNAISSSVMCIPAWNDAVAGNERVLHFLLDRESEYAGFVFHKYLMRYIV